MTQNQFETLQVYVHDFISNVRQFKKDCGDAYIADMLDDMDTLVKQRLECIREVVEG